MSDEEIRCVIGHADILELQDWEARLHRLEDRVADLIHFIHYRVSSVGTLEGYLADPEHEKKEKPE